MLQQVLRGAQLSGDGRYRYTLTRSWEHAPGWKRTAPAVWVMLNPSTADHEVDDPTIRRVVGFSRDFGFSQAIVVNLFALRATDPSALARADDPVGPLNDAVLATIAEGAGLIVAAWGAHPFAQPRAAQVRELLGGQVMCLGHTKAGHPRHPLYLPLTARLELL